MIGDDYAPDFEQIMTDREEARGERWLQRMDRRYGRIEDHREQPVAQPPGCVVWCENCHHWTRHGEPYKTVGHGLFAHEHCAALEIVR